jgi:hypothetical protein
MATKIIVTNGEVLRDEIQAGEAGIKPGMAVIRNNALEGIKSTLNSALSNVMMIATEDNLVNAGEAITDSYADNDIVSFFYPRSGDVFYVLLASGATGDITKGDGLDYDGAGGFDKPASGNVPAVIALETVDNSSGSGYVFIKVQKI